MIVLLALLNDGAILSIAYDRTEGSARPEAWDMRTVLTIATALGIIGVVASFTLVVLGDKVFGLDDATIQTLLYLKLSVAGHLTIFLTRTRGPFWSRPHPARIVLLAVVGTQAIATFLAAEGILVTPIGWGKAAAIWAYALAWWLVNDRVKLAAYGALAWRRARSRHGRTSRSSHMRRNGPEMTQSDLRCPVRSTRTSSAGSTPTGARRTTCRSGRSTCMATRCCASRCGPSTSSRGCSATGARRRG